MTNSEALSLERGISVRYRGQTWKFRNAKKLRTDDTGEEYVTMKLTRGSWTEYSVYPRDVEIPKS